MVTGEIKNKIDQIWDTFFVAGITNPITVLEQMTYIFFMKMLEEENARDWDSEVQNPTFLEGQLWVNPDAVSDEERAGVPYENLRWHVFKNFGAENMFKIVRQSVFEFIKHIGTGEESAYSRYMKSAIFLIPNARTLAKVVDGVDSLDMNNRDARYFLVKLDLSHCVSGATIPHIYFKDYGKELIPVPPLSTQHSIVSELDKISEFIRLKQIKQNSFNKRHNSIGFD